MNFSALHTLQQCYIYYIVSEIFMLFKKDFSITVFNKLYITFI